MKFTRVVNNSICRHRVTVWCILALPVLNQVPDSEKLADVIGVQQLQLHEGRPANLKALRCSMQVF